MHRPVISPVPNLIVTSSPSEPGRIAEPSQFTSVRVLDDFSAKRWCFMHEELSQSMAGTSKLPLPVSKTTEKDWAGVPMWSWPKYAVLCIAPLNSFCDEDLRYS